MKKEELRIGNLVISKMSGQLTVQMIPLDIDMNNYEPIQLTEEWLFKFGFEEDMVWIHKIKNISNNRMIGIDLNNNHVFLAQHDAHKHFRDVFINKCESVHQLQNLYFALTNEELSIKQQ